MIKAPIVRSMLLILGLSISAVLIADFLFEEKSPSKQTAIYIISFVLGLSVFEFWWRKRTSE